MQFLLFNLFILAVTGFSAESPLTNNPHLILPENVIQQRLSHPLLLDRQTLLKTETTDAALQMNLGQNKGRLPGSGFQATHKLSPHLKTIYENNLLLPYWSETIPSDRYLHQDKISLEWNLFSATSLQSNYSVQSEHALNQPQSALTETKQKELGLKGKIFKLSLWESGYRLIETERGHFSQETNLWYASYQQPITTHLGLLFQSEYRESGDPNQNWSNDDKQLHLGSGANILIQEGISAQLRFDLKMQEEQQLQNKTWVPEEKRITFSIKGAF